MPIVIPQRETCPFCESLVGLRQCAFVYRDETISSFVTPRRYGKGAMLVIPNRHAPTILELYADELSAIFQHAQELTQALMRAYDAEGFNIFQNNGVSAGQTVPHYHLHIVPRYRGEEPNRVFGEGRVERVSIEERILIAEEIRRHLG